VPIFMLCGSAADRSVVSGLIIEEIDNEFAGFRDGRVSDAARHLMRTECIIECFFRK
jgi:hypothetical protein